MYTSIVNEVQKVNNIIKAVKSLYIASLAERPVLVETPLSTLMFTVFLCNECSKVLYNLNLRLYTILEAFRGGIIDISNSILILGPLFPLALSDPVTEAAKYSQRIFEKYENLLDVFIQSLSYSLNTSNFGYLIIVKQNTENVYLKFLYDSIRRNIESLLKYDKDLSTRYIDLTTLDIKLEDIFHYFVILGLKGSDKLSDNSSIMNSAELINEFHRQYIFTIQKALDSELELTKDLVIDPRTILKANIERLQFGEYVVRESQDHYMLKAYVLRHVLRTLFKNRFIKCKKDVYNLIKDRTLCVEDKCRGIVGTIPDVCCVEHDTPICYEVETLFLSRPDIVSRIIWKVYNYVNNGERCILKIVLRNLSAIFVLPYIKRLQKILSDVKKESSLISIEILVPKLCVEEEEFVTLLRV